MKYLFFLIFLVISCNTNKLQKFDYNYSSNPWIQAFKDNFFYSSLKVAYKNDSTIFAKIESKDALNPYDGLDLEALIFIDSLSKKFVNDIPPPAMCEYCDNGENYFMAIILHYYASKEFNNIARKQYKLSKSRK